MKGTVRRMTKEQTTKKSVGVSGAVKAVLRVVFYGAACGFSVLLSAASFYDGAKLKGVLYALLAAFLAFSGAAMFFLPAGKLRKTVKIVSILLGLLLSILPTLGAYIGYHAMFHIRSDAQPEYITSAMAKYPGLEREEYTLTSSAGKKLAGYLYTCKDAEQKKAAVIFTHGYNSGGHGAYIDVIARLAIEGFPVFTYDATAHGASEGVGIGGMPRGVLDLAREIEYVEGLETYRDYPIMIMGHSWGGFSTFNELNVHPEVKAVVTMSGFDRSIDLIEAHLKSVKPVKQYLIAAEFLTFGSLAFKSAVSGFKNSEAKVMVVHSRDDELVHMEYSVDRYKALIGEDDRITYEVFEKRNHSPFTNGPYDDGFDPSTLSSPVQNIDERLFRKIIALYESCME